MREKPPKAPEGGAPGIAPADPKSAIDITLDVVRAQRAMMWLLILKFVMDFTVGFANDVLGSLPALAYFCAYLAVSFAIAYHAFRLCSAIYGVMPGIICAICAFAPCIGTITILALDLMALDRLRKRGVKVGIMGATKGQLAELQAIAGHD